MLLGIIDVLLSCMPRLFTSETTVPVTERGDTTRPAVVPNEPSDAVKG